MIEITSHDDRIVELCISRPPVNAMDVATLRGLRRAFFEAREGGKRGVVLSGVPGVFSSGIDVVALLNGDEADVYEYWREVFLLASEMAVSPLPIVAAITGHCIAAGALLALFSDYRVMAEGEWRIGLNEVRAGVCLPDCFQLALRRVVGRLNAERLLVFGNLLDPSEAWEIGLVDELSPPEKVLSRAKGKLEDLLRLPSHSMLSTRENTRRDLAEAFNDVDALPVDEFARAFLEPKTQAALRKIAGNVVSSQ